MDRIDDFLCQDEPNPEYPDPEVAADCTIYPWNSRPVPQDSVLDSLQAPSLTRKGSHSEVDSETDRHPSPSAADMCVSESEAKSDSEFAASDDLESGDEYISDDSRGELQRETKTSRPRIDLAAQQSSDVFSLRKAAYSTAIKYSSEMPPRETGRNLAGVRSLNRRGNRRPLPPGPEVMSCISEATMALATAELDRAEHLTLQAMKMNPEVFQAHNLLSEIHAARGDTEKSISVAWNGAHTRPRDIRMWKRVASMILSRDHIDREESLRDALYCFSRIVTVDRHNLEARYERAALNHKLGHRKKAVAEYEFILNHLLPDDFNVLRHLAAVCNEMQDSSRALKRYEIALDHTKQGSNKLEQLLTWSDVNVLAELYLLSGKFEEGLAQVKKISRHLLGRSAEHIWDSVQEDDRELDAEHEPRRLRIPDFDPKAHSLTSYGTGLPLEIRVKLGLLRLSLGEAHSNEAMSHFEWLQHLEDTEDPRPPERRDLLCDLLREVSRSLRSRGMYADAIRFLETLRSVSDQYESQLLMDLASCHRSVGSNDEARANYEKVISRDPACTEARVALWNMLKISAQGHSDQSSSEKISPTRSISKQMRLSRQIATKQVGLEKSTPPLSATTNRKRMQHSTSAALLCLEQGFEIREMYHKWRDLRQQMYESEPSRQQCLEASNLLLQSFKDAKSNGSRAWRTAHRRFEHAEAGAAVHAKDWARSHHQIEESMNVECSKQQFHGISLTLWLDVFLENALEHARLGHILTAYGSIEAALNINLFTSDSEALWAIHLSWFACALLANDGEKLCNIARWFMVRYQHVSDTYRLFSALSRLCDSKNQWYNSSPTQKYVLRQLKSLDESLGRPPTDSSKPLEGATSVTDTVSAPHGVVSRLNVTLLMLYGHMLYVGKSFSHAINYFLRALSLNKDNTVVKLSLALAYLHWALKRQAENRHHLLLQGLAFLLEYYDASRKLNNVSALQEAEFNVGRTYQMLGLVDLAIPHYVHCLNLHQDAMKKPQNHPAETFTQEAALALRNHYAANGDYKEARRITMAWFVL